MKLLISLLTLFILSIIVLAFYYSKAPLGYPQSKHSTGTHFENLEPVPEKGILDVLKWKLTSDRESWPESIEGSSRSVPVLGPGQLGVTFVNHSTFYLQVSGVRVITDPIFSRRASPVSFAGPARVRPPGVLPEDLPGVDVVIISHNHYDHLDLPSLQTLEEKFSPLFIVPLGVAPLLRQEGLGRVRELDWWDTARVGDLVIHFTPAKHWSSRLIIDRNKTLWGSYLLVSGDRKIYFAGDTGYGLHFKEIQRRLGKPDLSLLPIGAYEPRWFMRDHHMNPSEAVLAHQELGSGMTLGMHYGTFQLTDEGIDDPMADLAAARLAAGVAPESFSVMDFGETRNY